MSGTLSDRKDRRGYFIFLGAGILILAVIVAIPLLRSWRSQSAVEQAPVMAKDEASEVEVAAPLYPPQVRRDLLERELKEAWRAQIMLQSSTNAAAARNTSGLERDVKDAARANLAASAGVTSNNPGLERDLKELWHAQIMANIQATSEDTTGLERDLKALWHAAVSAQAP
jgi:hypothetical protein